MKRRRKTVTNEVMRLRASYKRLYGESPQQINSGNCDEFANDLLTKFPKGYTFWGDEIPERFKPYFTEDRLSEIGCHCFFYIDGFYYDSECPNGVDHPAKLPFFRRNR